MQLISEKDYLEHHGIKGQKWGIRRYQNPDGSLTEAGKKRYANTLQSVYGPDRVKKREVSDYSEANKAIRAIVSDKKELKKTFRELQELHTAENDAYFEWAANKDLVKKTAESYVKSRNKTGGDAAYYLQMGGGDAWTNVWWHYVDSTPSLKALTDKKWDLQKKYREQSRQVFNDLLGEYGSKKMRKDIPNSQDFSDFLASKAEEYMLDDLYDMPDLHGR